MRPTTFQSNGGPFSRLPWTRSRRTRSFQRIPVAMCPQQQPSEVLRRFAICSAMKAWRFSADSRNGDGSQAACAILAPTLFLRR